MINCKCSRQGTFTELYIHKIIIHDAPNVSIANQNIAQRSPYKFKIHTETGGILKDLSVCSKFEMDESSKLNDHFKEAEYVGMGSNGLGINCDEFFFWRLPKNRWR